ncbi:MAG: RNA polymerase subunit sigma-24 [Myxococcaceae bacterium]|jgi:RNA polymerase sigma-70 factor (ECF subfamily)|nr:RNA polymerase subunit sigma-24 [Myxococcaceae bacterium]
MKPEASSALELAFRRSSARLVAQLYARLGGTRLDLAEDATQFSLLQATRQWPVRGVPDAPDAWLARVAHNRLTDLVRGAKPTNEGADDELALPPVDPPERLSQEFGDDELRLLFATCHPALSVEVQVTLCLKLACGLSVREIARALLSEETAIAQRLVRARKTLQALGGALEVPGGAALGPRLLAVHQALYVLFNEGYERTDGESLVDVSLCAEALRLVEGVVSQRVTSTPEGHALAALFCFKAATLDSRVDGSGSFVPAARRGPARPELIARGVLHLKHAMGTALSRWHLEAELALIHAQGPSNAWPWPRILSLYDDLVRLDPSPLVALNRLVAVAEVEGPHEALAALERLPGLEGLEAYPWRHAIEGSLHRRLGALPAARRAFLRAADFAISEPQRRFLLGEARACADA